MNENNDRELYIEQAKDTNKLLEDMQNRRRHALNTHYAYTQRALDNINKNLWSIIDHIDEMKEKNIPVNKKLIKKFTDKIKQEYQNAEQHSKETKNIAHDIESTSLHTMIECKQLQRIIKRKKGE